MGFGLPRLPLRSPVGVAGEVGDDLLYVGEDDLAHFVHVVLEVEESPRVVRLADAQADLVGNFVEDSFEPASQAILSGGSAGVRRSLEKLGVRMTPGLAY